MILIGISKINPSPVPPQMYTIYIFGIVLLHFLELVCCTARGEVLYKPVPLHYVCVKTIVLD
jgi:hypothetical protein